MSNFTKSILYSTTVLAAGLVAIFSIYNNVTKTDTAAAVANITPAAGQSDLGINFNAGDIAENMTTMASDAVENAGEAMTDGATALNDVAAATGYHVSDAASNAMDAVATITDISDVKPDMLNDVTETVGEKLSDAVETPDVSLSNSGEELIDSATTALENATDATTENTLENSIEAAAGEAIDDTIDTTVENAVEGIDVEVISNEDDILEKVLNITGE